MKDMGETQKKVFGYFRAYESEQFSFYRIPKVLFTDAYFKELSTEAKVLYGLMLDRMALSERNQWFDESGRVYIIFTVEEVMSCMNCGRDKSVKVLSELDARNGIGLIERIRRGLGQPDIIYVKNFIRTEAAEETQSFLKSEKPISGVRKNRQRRTAEKAGIGCQAGMAVGGHRNGGLLRDVRWSGRFRHHGLDRPVLSGAFVPVLGADDVPHRGEKAHLPRQPSQRHRHPAGID